MALLTRRQILGKMVDFAKNRDGFSANKAQVRFIFFKHRKTGKISYRKIYILDMRYWKRAWQKRFLNKIPIRIKVVGVFIAVIMVPRRQGKTFMLIQEGIGQLMKEDAVTAPIGKYFCLEKDQAMRNAEEAIELAILNIPGAKYDKDDGKVVIPFPTLKHPHRTLRFFIFGGRGGEDTKRGDHGEITIFDEGDGFTRSFINKVGISSASDNDGTVFISGTNFFKGVLSYYINKAKEMEDVSRALDAGTFLGEAPKSAKNWRYFEEEAHQTKVYSEEKQDVLKEVMGEEDYSKEFSNVDLASYNRFYYRKIMDDPVFERTHHTMVIPENYLPVWIYYDLGVGTKSDRLAMIMVQHMMDKLYFLWGLDWVNGRTEDAVVALKHQNPFPHLPIQEHILPHDGASRDGDHNTPETMLQDYLIKHSVGGVTRVRPRTKALKVSVDRCKDMLQKTIFHRQHAGQVWEACYEHRKKEIDEGLFSDEPAKTKFRDLADACRLAWEDHYTGDFRTEATFQQIPQARTKLTEVPPLLHEDLDRFAIAPHALSHNDDCFSIGV